jgi:hypothetical protein
MEIGMMWWDNTKTPLTQKIQKAMDYHLEKYGSTPTLAEVHPSMLEEVNIIVLRPSRYVLPGNIWIGVEDVKN